MDVIDINIFETTETVDINVTPNLTTVNINRTTNVSPVTSVNGQVGDVIIPVPTNTSDLTNDGADGVNPFITLNDVPPSTIPNLQSVTDEGNSTTNQIIVELGQYKNSLGVSSITTENTTSGASIYLSTDDGIVISNASGSGRIKADNMALGNNPDFQLPNKSGTFTIATIDDIPTNTSQLTNDGANGINPFITALDIPTSGQAGSLVREVKNMTGTTLTKGTVVYISGANGNKALVSKAQANAESSSARTFGLLQSDILNNGLGNCVIIGDLSGLNTSAFTEGAQLYLSGTVAGAYTDVKTLAPTHLVYIGKITRSHPTLGQIEVAIQNGYELDEIHDVSIISKTNNDIIQYDNATSLWKNRSLSNAGIQPTLTNPITGTGTIGTIPKFNGSTTSLADSTIIQLANGDITINGLRSGKGNNTLSDNTVFGVDSGKVISTGQYNSLFGFNAGISLTTGNFNTFIGRMAGNSNSSGSNNTFIGLNAGYGNTTLSDCVSVGFSTGYGTDCTFIGSNAGKNQSGSYNTYFGKNSGQAANANSYNSYFGNQSGENSTSTQNSFFGHGTGTSTTGANNTFIGTSSGQNNTSGNNNVYIGQQAGLVTIGSAVNALSTTSVLIGAATKTLASGDTNEIVIGYNATGIGSNTAVLGNDSITKTILKGSIAIGTTSPVSSAKVTIESTTQGFLPPRMTTTQKNAIVSPVSGLVVYDSTLGKLCVRGASAWETITSI